MGSNIKTNDSIIYSGKVHIQYIFENKKRNIYRHNTGYLPLFTSIVLALGEKMEEAKLYMPRYIKAKNASGDDCLNGSHKVILQDRKYYSGGSSSAATNSDTIRYTFVIPVSNLNPGEKITQLQLINERDGICADITLTGTGQISTDIGANLLIYWDLTFKDGDTIIP